MRIAINAWFADQPTTGSGQYLTHLLAEYTVGPAGHQYLVCGHTRQAIHTPVVQHRDPLTWQVLRTPFDDTHRHLSKLWFEQVRFPRACRCWKADLIHVPYWGSPLLSPVPTVVTVHDLIPLLLPAYSGGRLGRWYTRLVAASARRAARVLTDSEAARRDIVGRLGIPPERVQAIHLAAEGRFRPVGDAQELERVHLKYDLPARYLLYLGGFDMRKNVPGVLRAYARLDVPGMQMVIAGKLPSEDSAFFPDPRRVAGELGILDRVLFTGWIDECDKPALYTGATAFVFPSFYEGFGLPPLEAMSCGTAVIVSDRGSLPEVVGDAGLCVDPDDPDATTAAMRRVITEPAFRDRLRRAGLARAQRFGWRRCAQETLAAYRCATSP